MPLWHNSIWSIFSKLGFSVCVHVYFINNAARNQSRSQMMFMAFDIYLCVGSIVLSQMHISVDGQNCTRKITRPALYGYRCVTETEEYSSISNNPPHICTHQCMQRHGCRIVNYNSRLNTCFLGMDGCVLLHEDESFQVNVFGTTHPSECLQWQPPPAPVSGDTSPVISNMCHQSHKCSVGRLTIGNSMLPGKYLHGSGDIWSVLNGAEVKHGIQEILTVSHECQVVWMPFNASNTLPIGAVLGGHLENDDRELYVVRARAGPTLIPLGFYDPVTAQGYVPYYGVQEVTGMEILVLM